MCLAGPLLVVDSLSDQWRILGCLSALAYQLQLTGGLSE
jgi:hypothetical protein